MQKELISLNKNIYDVIAPLYEGQHVEIFNQTEQNRIRKELGWALSQIACSTSKPLTLDFGSGTGNLTRHLLHLGAHVVAADISEACLGHLVGSIGGDGRLWTLLLNGSNLENIKSETFDMVAAYSVLHHIPDYLTSVQELVRVMKPGGVVVIDHENSPRFWEDSEDYADYRDELARQEPNGKETLLARLRRVFLRRGVVRYLKAVFWHLRNPSIGEGDIHVYPDDHVDWVAIRRCLESYCEILKEEDYLVCRERKFPAPVWEKWHELTVDMRLIVARKLN